MRGAKNSTLITMDDVAAHASVSKTTVSYVLNGRTVGVNIPTDTRQRVLEAARHLGYRRNQMARAMVTGKSRIIGVFTSPADAEVSLRVLSGAMEYANQNDYLLKVMHLHYYGIDDVTLARCAEWRIAGAMILGISEGNQERLYRELEDKSLPLVMVDNTPEVESGVCVLSDDAQGLGSVVAHLVNLGHRRIAFLGGRPCYLSERRLRFFREIMTKAGLDVPEPWARDTSWGDQEVIKNGVLALLKNPVADRPTAIVCSGDNVAMIVLRVAHSLGLRVPEDLSVSGYANTDLSSFAAVPLTTVDQSFRAMGSAAIQYLVECDQRTESEKRNESPVKKEILVPTHLIVRASTAVPPPPA